MLWSAARKITVSKPKPCQMLAMETDMRDVEGSASQSWPGIPKNSRNLLSRPASLRIIFHIDATTTSDMVTGRKKADRKNAWKARALLSRRAETSPRNGPIVMVTIAKTAVLLAAAVNVGSLIRSA